MKSSPLSFSSLARSTALKTVLCASVLATLPACHPNSKSASRVDTAAILADQNLTASQKSEKLALAAEQLVNQTGFIYADSVASVALQLDPQNVRARFWKAALGPVMQTRGLANRVAPLMNRLGKDADYQQFLKSLHTETADVQTVAFLMDGPQDIQTEKDVQDYVAQTTLRVDEFRRVMHDLRGQNLSIQLNSDLKNAWKSDQRVTCTNTQIADGIYESTCDASHSATIDLNAADFEALEMAAAGEQIYVTVLNGWNLTSAIDTLKAQADQPSVAPDVTIQKLLSNPSFGRMRDPQTFGAIPDIAKDVVIGVRYAAAKQAELCPTGDSSAINRPGQLFENGFCSRSGDITTAQLNALEASLGGTPTLITLGDGGSVSQHLVNLKALFTNSSRDVRTLLPVQRDSCGQVTSVSDSTFGGAFQPGDLNQVLSQSAAANCPAQ